MTKTILRVLEGTELTPDLSSKLDELLPLGYTIETAQKQINYTASITRRINSLHSAFLFILDVYPSDSSRTYFDKETIRNYAQEVRDACNLSQSKPSALQKELSRFTHVLVGLIQSVGYVDEYKSGARAEKAAAFLNEAEKYFLMSQGRPNTATLSQITVGTQKPYILQIDEVVPACSALLLEELTYLKNTKFPSIPSWFKQLKAEEQAYIAMYKNQSLSVQVLIDDLDQALALLSTVRATALSWTSDLDCISEKREPYPRWFSERLNKAQQELIRMLILSNQELVPSLSTLREYLIRRSCLNDNPRDLNQFNEDLSALSLLPTWYLVLSAQQQAFLKYVINSTVDIETAVSFLPSRLRSLPAPANFQSHRLVKINSETFEVEQLQDKRLRSSHIASRELINEPSIFRFSHSISNLKSILGHSRLDQDILLQTLISPVDIPECIDYLGLPDKPMSDDLKAAAHADTEFSPRIYQHNHPLNYAKIMLYNTASNPNNLKLINKIQSDIESPSLPTSIKNDLSILLEQYIQLLNLPLGVDKLEVFLGRELFLSSLEQLLFLIKGGFCYGSCISGKDRKAIELIHTDAMLIYKSYYGVWPNYPDQPVARQNFVAIVASLYVTRHQQALAGQNAPGAEGIKTPDNYFPPDICREIILRLGDDNDALTSEDKLASTNEVKDIVKAFKVSKASNVGMLKAHLLSRQLGSDRCRSLYDKLTYLVDLGTCDSAQAKKQAKSNFFAFLFSDGVTEIQALMKNPNPPNIMERWAMIVKIILDRPEVDLNRSERRQAMYSGVMDLLTPSKNESLEVKFKRTLDTWELMFDEAKNSNRTSKITPSRSTESF